MSTIVLGVASGAIYGLAAVGIVLVYKASRVLNFAQAEFGTFALYIAWQLIEDFGWPWAAGGLVAVLAMALCGVLFERLVVRPMGEAPKVALSVSTIGLLFLLGAVELKVWGPGPKVLPGPVRGTGPNLFGFFLTPAHLLALAVLAALAAGLGLLVARTRFGLALLAVAQDPATARLMGVPYHRVSAATWAAAGALGAVAGLLVEPTVGAFGPYSLSTSFFVRGLTAALLGGLTSLPGAFVGGIAVGVIEAAVQRLFLDVTGVGSFGMLIVILVVLLVRPQGLFGRQA